MLVRGWGCAIRQCDMWWVLLKIYTATTINTETNLRTSPTALEIFTQSQIRHDPELENFHEVQEINVNSSLACSIYIFSKI